VKSSDSGQNLVEENRLNSSQDFRGKWEQRSSSRRRFEYCKSVSKNGNSRNAGSFRKAIEDSAWTIDVEKDQGNRAEADIRRFSVTEDKEKKSEIFC